MNIDMSAIENIAKDKAIDYGKNKANETLSDQQKFSDTLDKINKSAAFKKFEKVWNEADEFDKEKVYKNGAQVSKNKVIRILDPLGAIQTTKFADPALVAIQAMNYKSKELKKLKLLVPGQTLEPTFRLCVQLGMLKRPTSLTDAVLLDDMQTDFKAIDLKLMVFEAVATVVPYLRPILPLIQVLKSYVKKLGQASIQKVATEQAAKEDAVSSPEGQTNKVVENTKTWTTVLGSNVQQEQIKDTIIKNFTTKKDTKNTTTPTPQTNESQQQVKSENTGIGSMKSEDSIEKIAA